MSITFFSLFGLFYNFLFNLNIYIINGIIWFTYMLTALGFTAPVLSGYLVEIILNLKELS